MLYLPTAIIQACAALGHTDAYSAWWLDYAFAMARVAIVPFTVDWTAIRREISRLRWFIFDGRVLD